MFGGNLGSLLYGDVSVMIFLAEAHNRTEVGFKQPTFQSGVRHSPTEPPSSPRPKIENVQRIIYSHDFSIIHVLATY